MFLQTNPWNNPALDISVLLTAVTTAVAVLSFFNKSVRRRVARPFVYLYHSLTLPHKLNEEMTRIEATLRSMDAKMDTLVHQVTTNGGNSLVDMVKLVLMQLFIESASRRRLMDAYGYAFWESDRNGLCTYASEELANILGLHPDEVLGNGWITNLAPEERVYVKEQWDIAVKERRRFTLNYSFVHPDGTRIRVQGLSFPIIHHGKVEGFVGVLTPIE